MRTKNFRAAVFRQRVMYTFLGSDAFALAVLENLAAEELPAAIVTTPDRSSGRGMKIRPGPLARFAMERGLPLLQPESLRGAEAQSAVLAPGADRMILVSYGLILPRSFLDSAPPVLNAHASLLPHWRGASPIQSVLLHGEAESGCTVMRIVPALDAGPVISLQHVAVTAEDDYGSLSAKLAAAAGELLRPLLKVAEIPQGISQNHALATFCGKIAPGTERLRPREQDAATAWNIVRAFAPKPGAYVELAGVERPLRLKVLKAVVLERGPEPSAFLRVSNCLLLGCREGALQILRVQPEGRPAMEVEAFLNGWRGKLALA